MFSNLHKVPLYLILFSLALISLNTLTADPNIDNNFDLEKFLDPQVAEEIISIPTLEFTDSKNVGKSKQVAGPPKDDFSFRQISLAPTEAFIARRSFNTACAFTIPLFTFTLPQTASPDTPAFVANQMVYALFGFLYTVSSFIVPVLFTGIRDPTITGRSNVENTQVILNRLLSPHPVIDFMGAETKYKIGLDSSKCLLKTICEAHRSPQNEDYGLLALPFQIFFPPSPNGTDQSKSSAAQIAAKIGKYKYEDCGKVYPCFFDVLDLAVYFRNLVFGQQSFVFDYDSD